MAHDSDDSTAPVSQADFDAALVRIAALEAMLKRLLAEPRYGSVERPSLISGGQPW